MATLTLNNTGTQVGSIREGTEQSTVENISFNLQIQKVPAIQKEKFALSFGRSLEAAEGLLIAYPPVSPELYPVLRSSRDMPSPLEDKQKKTKGPSKFRKSEVSVAASKAGWLATAPGRKSHMISATTTVTITHTSVGSMPSKFCVKRRVRKRTQSASGSPTHIHQSQKTWL